MACSVSNPIDCISSVAGSVAGDAFSSIAKDFAHAADSAVNWLWNQLGSSTAVHLGGAAFDVDLGIIVAITGTVALGLFLVQVITSTLRRDPGGLARAARGLLVAFIAGGVAVGVTNVLLGAVDALSTGVVHTAMGTDLHGMGSKVLSDQSLTGVSNPAAMMLLSVAAIAAVVIVWLALTIRKVLIVVSAVFAPLAFAGSLADITVSWTRRWIEAMVALIFSKLILVLIFVIGWGVLEGAGQVGTGTSQTLTQLVSGLLILTLAGFSPWLALKLVHFSGDQFHHLHGMAAAASTGAQKVASAPQKAAAWKASAAGAAAGGGAGAASAFGSTSRGRSRNGAPLPFAGGSPGRGEGGSPAPVAAMTSVAAAAVPASGTPPSASGPLWPDNSGPYSSPSKPRPSFPQQPHPVQE